MGHPVNLSKNSEQRLINRKQRRYNSKMKDARTDNKLLEAVARKRDKTAFLELFDRYGKNANALAYHITGDRNLAEEATQEGMLNVWISAHTFRSDGVAKKWILCVVANAANQVLRTRNREKIRIQKSAQLEPSQVSTGTDREEMDEREGMLDVLRKQTLRLPVNDRKLLALYYGAGLKQNEIGEMLSMPQRTVSHRLKEALAQLRENLGAAGYSSILAIFTDSLFQEALVSGTSLRSDVSKNIMDAINRMPESEPAGLVAGERPLLHGAGRSLSALIACCVIFSVGAYAFWRSEQQKTTDLAESQAQRSALKQKETSQADALSATWKFDLNDRPEIPIMRGRWISWLPEKRGLAPAVLSPNGSNNVIWITLPVEIPTQAFVVEVSLRIPSKKILLEVGTKTAGCNGYLGPADTSNGILDRWNLKKISRINRAPDYSFTSRIYVKGCYQVQLPTDYSFPFQVIKYEKNHPHTKFSLGLHGYVVEGISIQTFTEDTFPIDAKKWASFTVNIESISKLGKIVLRSRVQ